MGLLSKVISKEDFDPTLHSGEAYILWEQLLTRYDTLELTLFIFNLASDTDFKALVARGVDNLIMPQIKRLETTMDHYRVPLPERPPKSINLSTGMDEARDVHLFRLILDGSQTALGVHIKAINVCTNDSLRNLFMNFLIDDLKMYDDLVKYGKLKGWVRNAPEYKH